MMTVEKICYDPKLAIDQVANLIAKQGNGFLIFEDQHNDKDYLVTDGDLRRAYVEKKSVLSQFVNKNPRIALSKFSAIENEIFAKSQKLEFMLMLDEHGRVSGYQTFRPPSQHRSETVVIMAGGLGARLGDLTHECPKPMLKIHGAPMIAHVIKNCVEHGFNKFIICLNYLAEKIEEYLAGEIFHYLHISTIVEPKRLGTAGALSLLDDESSENILVTNADILTSFDLAAFMNSHTSEACDLTVASKEVTVDISYGVLDVNSENEISGIIEKPSYAVSVSAGIYCVKKSNLKIVPKNKFYDFPEFIADLCSEGKTVRAHKINTEWSDLGTFEDLQRARNN